MAGKPPAEIHIEQLIKLAALNVTVEEAASYFKCCKRTMLRYLEKPDFAAAWESGKASGRMSLRRLQWQHANGKGSSAVQMTIHLSKHWLGETDKFLNEHSGPGGGPIETKDVSARDILASRIAALAARGEPGEGA